MPASPSSRSDDWIICSEGSAGEQSPSSPDSTTSGATASASSTHSADLLLASIEGMDSLAVHGLAASLPPAALLTAAGSAQLSVPLPRSSFHLGVLVVGEPGCGKTTLVHNLFHPFANKPKSYSAAAKGEPLDVSSISGQLSEFVAATEGADFAYSVLEVDLPAFDAGATQAACRLVSGRDQEYERRWAATRSACDKAALPDGRIDVCLFMLPPHTLSKGAVTAIQQLSKHVPVLPVLGKADAMTPPELAGLRKAALQELGLLGPLAFPSDAKLLAEAGAALGAGSLPLATVGSMENKQGVDGFWPVRDYPWGCVEVFNSPHSDMLLLRRLLLEAGFFQLKRASGQRSAAASASPGSAATATAVAATPTPAASPSASSGPAGSASPSPATPDAAVATPLRDQNVDVGASSSACGGSTVPASINAGGEEGDISGGGRSDSLRAEAPAKSAAGPGAGGSSASTASSAAGAIQPGSSRPSAKKELAEALGCPLKAAPAGTKQRVPAGASKAALPPAAKRPPPPSRWSLPIS